MKFPVWDALEERYAVGGVSVEVTPLVETARALELSRQGFELLANTMTAMTACCSSAEGRESR